jgi:hypothetical protein
MKLPGLTIPEIEKLPPSERESLLRRFDETDQLRRFRSRAQLLGRAGMLCAAGVPILLSEFKFHWHPAVTIVIVSFLAFGVMLTYPYVSMLWQLRIIRRLLRRDLGK